MTAGQRYAMAERRQFEDAPRKGFDYTPKLVKVPATATQVRSHATSAFHRPSGFKFSQIARVTRFE